ncbi:ABC transporter ATP-binding protein [Desulfosporosinus sp.]|uniref:ABC transporter ATP-binding protein n=1 Tax=Desulfosporosinus sp. TaxID=157907 RepID=UPI000E9128F0|nr:ABC transporter ATP-binding protein [Desulfosporosinus sp.]MBC2723948.1 ABC transporter ATP-binding protein [Desulfosporosinus sp.]MBC2725207.1 ABC transporter ATP-binding protein [Desulfosporosinus sp.]HBV88751.1 ABC transporter ATP-binding protein [Desulfosporosinus sp.]
MLSFDSVSVHYGVIPALTGVCLQVKPGEVVALIGANGAGKTTTLKTISGLLRPSHGSIMFDSQDITKLSADKIVKLGIIHVPEGRGVFPNLTVKENLMLGAYVRKDKAIIARDLENVFTKFPRLHERKEQYGGTLSGGEQQMLAIGRSIMAAPKLLLLDEPSMGLAPLVVKEIFRTIREIKKSGTTILLVEQNANMALANADRAYVIETGKIVIEGTASDLRANPEVQQAYLGSHKKEGIAL